MSSKSKINFITLKELVLAHPTPPKKNKKQLKPEDASINGKNKHF